MSRRDDIIVVSGQPRSGTSMMMKAIHAGGIAPVIDHICAADEDNPKGYYEFEPVKKTKEDASWLKDAPGKVVKMVYRLLYDLPTDDQYRVVFMRRDLTEVLPQAPLNSQIRSRQKSDRVTSGRIRVLAFFN